MVAKKQLADAIVDRTVKLVVGLVAVMVLIVLVSSVANHENSPRFDAKETVWFEDALYGDPVVLPDGIRVVPVPYDSIWGPLYKQSEMTVGVRTAGNCIAEGERKVTPIPGFDSTYPSLLCPFLR